MLQTASFLSHGMLSQDGSICIQPVVRDANSVA